MSSHLTSTSAVWFMVSRRSDPHCLIRQPVVAPCAHPRTDMSAHSIAAVCVVWAIDRKKLLASRARCFHVCASHRAWCMPLGGHVQKVCVCVIDSQESCSHRCASCTIMNTSVRAAWSGVKAFDRGHSLTAARVQACSRADHAEAQSHNCDCPNLIRAHFPPFH
jgi:hypothetical protein